MVAKDSAAFHNLSGAIAAYDPHRYPKHNSLAVDRMFETVVDNSFKVAVPSVLYHYTGWQGAEGILKSQAFWETAHDCTNDEAELRSADATVMEVASDLRSVSPERRPSSLICYSIATRDCR